MLTAATGGRAIRDAAPGRTHGWVHADGQLAGHTVRIFTAIDDGTGNGIEDTP